MCISEAFCDRNLSLLFTTLERSKDTSVSDGRESPQYLYPSPPKRCSVMTVLCGVAVRFNLLLHVCINNLFFR